MAANTDDEGKRATPPAGAPDPAATAGATSAPEAGGEGDADRPASATARDAASTNAEIMSRIAREAESEGGARSADRMADRLINDLSADPNLAGTLGRSPELVREFADVAKLTADAALLRQYDLEIIKSNGQLYLLVVGCVGASLVLVVMAIAVLSLYQLSLLGVPVKGTITIAVPDGLIALGSAAIGALAGLLTPLTGRR